MNILVSNDDGIYAEGIKVLVNTLRKSKYNVYVVAPKKEESGTGHGITLHRPLRVEEVKRGEDFFGYSVDGKPTDCVKLGYWGIYKDIKFDFIISGINRGQNLGNDLLYSGTVSAAAEGAMLGIKSIAISLDIREDKKEFYNTAAEFLLVFLEKIKNVEFPKDSLLNVNVPSLPADKIKGIRYTEQGDRKYRDDFIERIDPRGNKYYWLGGEVIESETGGNVDFNIVKEDYISITPINLNLTDKNFLEMLNKKIL